MPSFYWMYLPQLLFSVTMELFEELQFISHTEYAILINIPEKSIEYEKGKLYNKRLASHGSYKRKFLRDFRQLKREFGLHLKRWEVSNILD